MRTAVACVPVAGRGVCVARGGGPTAAARLGRGGGCAGGCVGRGGGLWRGPPPATVWPSPPPRPVRLGGAGAAALTTRRASPSARPAPTPPEKSRALRCGGGGASQPTTFRTLVAETCRAPSLPQLDGAWRLRSPVGGSCSLLRVPACP